MSDGIRFTKGHGTENDFVLILDRDGTRDLSPSQVVALAARRAGIGGDGVIRVVPTRFATDEHVRALAARAPWFMDYRNADGSPAQMCGNGTRVTAELLAREGLVDDEVVLATRAGARTVVRDPRGWRTSMGRWSFGDEATARADGFDALVHLDPGQPYSALSLDLGNPHTVVALPETVDLDSVDLTVAPEVRPTPLEGVNVEIVRPLGPGHLSMRVHERGVGETRSCGTGACAAALAMRFWAGEPDGADRWTVDVPGGRLEVTVRGDEVELAGPAVLVADGTSPLVTG